MIPQLIYLTLGLIGLGIHLGKDGEPKEGLSADYNFFVAFIAWCISLGLLYWGGFFDIFFV